MSVGVNGVPKESGMATLLFLSFLFFSLQNVCFTDDAVVGPPTFNDSFIAMGEMVASDVDDKSMKIQANFEETYDIRTGNGAFIVREMGMNVTFVEEALAKQTFRYFNGECTVITAESWLSLSESPITIGYKDSKGQIRFSIRQLLSISNDKLVKEEANKETTYRGVQARSWLYTIESDVVDGNKTVVNLYEYWSDESWSATSGVGEQVPLGFLITKITHDQKNKVMVSEEQNINIYGFVKGTVYQKVFEPRQGIVCPDRETVFTFPKLATPKALSLKSEYVLPDYSEIKTMDMWLDMENGMLRVDLDRMDGQDPTSKSRRFTSQITSKKLGKTFSFDVFEGVFTCKAYDIDEYEIDYQELVNPKIDIKQWNFDNLLFGDTKKYTHIGKTAKRNIPCHLYQGTRKDWPNAGTTSLWEWCVSEKISDENEAIKFRDGEIALINAQVSILESKDEAMKGFRMIHHFYDVIEEKPVSLSIGTFDISRCFKVDQQRNLLFKVDLKIDDDNLDNVENVVSSVDFLSQWKSVIADKSGLPLETLRITKVSSGVYDKTLLIYFTLLDIHPDLRKTVKQKSMDEAFKSLQTAINSNKLAIKYPIKKEENTTLTAVEDSLEDVVGKTEDVTVPTPGPTTPTTKGTLIPFTLEPVGSSTSSKGSSSSPDGTSTESPVSLKEAGTGHGPGTVAGVTIAMLVIGFTAGAGGAFYKLRR